MNNNLKINSAMLVFISFYVLLFSDAYAGENVPREALVETELYEKENKSIEKKSIISHQKRKVFKKTKKVDVQSMLKQGDVDSALAMLEKISFQDRSWNTYFLLGTAYLLKNRFKEAAQALDNALALQGDIADIWIQRATVEQEQNNLAAAVQLLKVAIQINPRNAKAYLNLAYAYEMLEKPKSARAAYGYYLKFADGKSVEDIRLKQRILSDMVKKPS